MRDSRYLTPPQVAKRYGVKPETVRAWIRRGLLKALQTPGTKRPRFKIREEDLREFEKQIEFVPRKNQRRRPRKRSEEFVAYY